MTKQRIRDDGDLRRWYAQIPNLVYDLGLSPNAGWLYGHYKRICGANGGSCEEGSRKTAKRSCMSVGSVSSAKRELFLAGLINVYVSRRGNRTYHRIEVVDIWEQNFKRYSKDEMVSIEDIKNAIKRSSDMGYFSESSDLAPESVGSIIDRQVEDGSIVGPRPVTVGSADLSARRSTIEHINNKKERTVEDSEKIIVSHPKEYDDVPVSETGLDSILPPVAPYGRNWEPPPHSSASEKVAGKRMTYKDVWLATQGQLELQLNRATYDTWARDAKFYSFEDGTLTLYARSQYAQEWLATSLARSIMRAYSGISQANLTQLKIITHGRPPVIVAAAVEAACAASNLPSKPAVQHVKLNSQVMERVSV